MQVLFVFVMLSKGFEGRVLKNSPVDCFSAAPLRPQTGESHTLRQNKQHLHLQVLFFIVTFGNFLSPGASNEYKKQKTHPAERSLYMKDNAFTKYFILILLLLCVVVTPFSSCHKENDILPSDTVSQDTTPAEPALSGQDKIWETLGNRLIYRCDDVNRTADAPIFGIGSVTLSIDRSIFRIDDCRILRCDDGCDPVHVVSLASQGYASAYDMELVDEYSVEDGWSYPTKTFRAVIPEGMREDLIHSGQLERMEAQLAHTYYYLLTLDDTHYAYFCFTEKKYDWFSTETKANLADNTARSATVSFTVEPVSPAKETILRDGVPYTGELNGTHSCQVLTASGRMNRTITVNEDKVTVESYQAGTEPRGAYQGTLEYDPVTGDLFLHLSFKYYEGKGTTVYGSYKVVRGKLYEYNDRVYFICEQSDFGGLSPNNPQLMSFAPQHVTPDTLSVAEWAAAGFKEYEASSRIFYTIRSFLRSDVDDFAKRCGVNAKVYDSLRGMKFGTYRLYREEIPAVGDPQNTRGYAVLEVEILESQNDALCAGTHRLVFHEGLAITFTPLDEFKRYSSAPAGTVSPAQRYVMHVGSDRDFYHILGENRSQFGLCDFIMARLNAMAGNYEPRTAEEIRAYAETYLGVDGDTLNIETSLYKQDGGYIRIGRGSASYEYTFVSEEIRDGITVVTVQFWADYSHIVPSRLVEFHLEWMGSEYRPVKTVILEDSKYATATYST